MDPWKVQRVLKEGVTSLSDTDRRVLERYSEFLRCTTVMSPASVEKQFEAAVQLIKGLPKDGPFQPSNDMKLRLYGYFKQATQGPCRDPAPSFWDVVGKAKWGAWKANGAMPAEQAMRSYVDEIKQIMETMSLTDDMASLMDTLGPVYEYVDENQAAVSASSAGSVSKPAAKKQVRFRTDENGEIDRESEAALATNQGRGRDFAVVENGHSAQANGGRTEMVDNGSGVHGNGVVPLPELTENGVHEAAVAATQPRPVLVASSRGSVTSDTDDEEFLDTVADPVASASEAQSRRRLDRLQNQVDHLSRVMDASSADVAAAAAQRSQLSPGLTHPECRAGRDQLLLLIRDLRKDLEALNRRFVVEELRHKTHQERSWPVVPELSSRSLLLLLAWPLVVQLVAVLVRYRLRQRR